MNHQHQQNKIRDDKRFNDFLATNIDSTINDRYCRTCNVRLVHNPRNSPYDKYLYSCPICNCTSNIHSTAPGEKLMATFPTHNIQSATDKKLIVQSDQDRLSRSKYFINKRLQEKNEIENQDPYLAILKKNNKITITNIEYFSPTAEEGDDYYDSR